MTKTMLIDATHDEETRVAVMDDDQLVEFDYESKFRKPLKGNIFLAKVTRVEPSLQAAFVNFGGNRHGFLPFSEIHPDYFRIPVADREALLAEQEAAIREAEEREQIEAAEDAAREAAEKNAKHDDVPDSEEESTEAEPPEESAVETGDDAADEDEATTAEAKEETAAEPEDSEDAAAETAEEDSSADTAEDEDKPDEEEEKPRQGRRGRRGRGRRRASYRSRRTEKYDDEDQETKFRFNLRRRYKIQEVVKRGQIMLVQVNKEERGNKGAAVGTYISLPGRYCVLMPNSPRAGGISRKIANYKDRNRMREIVRELEVPKGMSVILRTAGVSRTKAEIKRDLDYLIRLWNEIRDQTLQSSAPAMIYEEANLIKRAIRDLYTRDVKEIQVAGEEGYKTARSFMKMMIPSHAKNVKLHKDKALPLFNMYGAEHKIAEIGQTQVRLPSGGYLVINPTEALVSIDVNSGKATKERHIEETALRTNLEAAEEVARQLRLRDLGGLVVIDFIDMENRRNNGKVERKMRDALSGDRARIQVGRISSFGLMELSRQRMNPSLTESQYKICDHCQGTGRVRTADATSVMVLRALDQEGLKKRAAEVMVHVPANVALYILNYKREALAELEARHAFCVFIRVDEAVGASSFRVEVSKPLGGTQEEDGETPAEKPKRRRGRRGEGRRKKPEASEEQQDTEPNEEQAAEEGAQEEAPADAPTGDITQDNPPPPEDPPEDADKKPAKKKPARRKKSAAAKKKPEPETKAEKGPEQSEPDQPPQDDKDYETVNEAPKKKKRGWWSKG